MLTHERFAYLAEKYIDTVFRVAFSYLKSREDADDVTQEVFLRLVRSDALYAEHGKPLAYLYACARNVCADFYRGQRPVGALDEDDVQTIPDVRHADMDGRLTMAGALARLTEEEREVIELRYDQDLPMSDISAVTGKSRFALYRIERRALSRLKELMGEGNG